MEKYESELPIGRGLERDSSDPFQDTIPERSQEDQMEPRTEFAKAFDKRDKI